ncbi:MAG: S41 family peptidase [Bacteroidota bacterium]
MRNELIRAPIKQLFIILFSIVGTVAPLQAQPAETQFSVTELQSDFTNLRSRYESNLANLYLYTPKQTLDNVFDSLYYNLKAMSAREFYSYITPLSSVIKDGHSNIFPGNEVTKAYNEHSKFFPFNIYWSENKLFITKNFSSDSSLHPGTEISAINGMLANKIMNYLLQRQVRDGNNDNYALWILNNYFREYYSYHFGHPEYFAMSVKSGDSIRKVKVGAISKAVLAVEKTKSGLLENSDAIEYFRHDSAANTAVFTIKTWDKANLKKEIDYVFQQIRQKHIDNLILDLRDNQGGNSQPAIHLLSYLLNQPFEYFTSVKSVAAHSEVTQTLKSEKWKMMGINHPQKTIYAGNLFVLINGGCFSNTGAFCLRLQFFKKGIFIGEETGGNKVVFSGVFGLKEKIILPNTKIICDNANYQLIVTDLPDNTGHGVLPDYCVVPTIDNIINNQDVLMIEAYKLINQKK